MNSIIKILFLLVLLTSLTVLGCSKASHETGLNEIQNGSNQEIYTHQPKYELVYERHNHRYDGGSKYYVLIEPVNISSNEFIEEVKIVIKEMVKKKGAKISIEFFDDREALIIGYKLYGDLSLNRPLTKDENEKLERHHVAGFSGELKTGIFLNSLYFFPEADSQHSTVGKYVEMIEFNP